MCRLCLPTFYLDDIFRFREIHTPLSLGDGFLEGEELLEIVSDMMRKVEIDLTVDQLESLVEVSLAFWRCTHFWRRSMLF